THRPSVCAIRLFRTHDDRAPGRSSALGWYRRLRLIVVGPWGLHRPELQDAFGGRSSTRLQGRTVSRNAPGSRCTASCRHARKLARILHRHVSRRARAYATEPEAAHRNLFIFYSPTSNV